MELHELNENVEHVENCNFLKVNYQFLSVIWVKWKQPVYSIIFPYSSTFYSLFLPFVVREIFKFNYDKFFVRHSASIFKSKWFEESRLILNKAYLEKVYLAVYSLIHGCATTSMENQNIWWNINLMLSQIRQKTVIKNCK